jgi:hypothetical protein
MTQYEYFSVNDKITMKKPHPCGGYTWTVSEIGLDCKIHCDTCSHILIASGDSIRKWAKLIE